MAACVPIPVRDFIELAIRRHQDRDRKGRTSAMT